MLTLTAPLSSYCFPTPGVEPPSPAAAAAQTELTLACNVYRLLHYVPPEYFIRPVRAELVKRAMAGDVQICTELDSANKPKSKAKREYMGRSNARLQEPHTEEMGDGVPAEELKKWSRRLTFVRVFLQRMGQFLNTSSHTVSFIFLLHTVLMQDTYEDFLGFCQPSAQLSIVHTFPFRGTHDCHSRSDTITRCVRSELFSVCISTMISALGASCAHRNRRQQHPSPVSYLHSWPPDRFHSRTVKKRGHMSSFSQASSGLLSV